MKIDLTFSRVYDFFLIILAFPLILAYYLSHLYEQAIQISDDWKDYLFMKRFNLIDSKHVSDFISWNKKYVSRRELAEKFEKVDD